MNQTHTVHDAWCVVVNGDVYGYTQPVRRQSVVNWADDIHDA